MDKTGSSDELGIEVDNHHVAELEIRRPPNNFFDIALIRSLADAYDDLGELDVRAIVLCSTGKHFCAGADFHGQSSAESLSVEGVSDLYREALRLFRAKIPVIAAVQGAAVGGGLGLACSADFRIAVPQARFSANFARLGFHQGFGLSVTLPGIVGHQTALDLLYTGRRMGGEEAFAKGLADQLVPLGDERAAAHALATEIAGSAPLAVRAIRQTLRGKLADAVAQILVKENEEQTRLRSTADFAEGSLATLERRPPRFSAI